MNCCTMRLGWGPILTTAIAAILACPRDSSADITLTGVNEYSTDSSGNWTGELWDTRGANNAYTLWVINGGFGGMFVNDADSQLTNNLPLPNGTYTMSFHGEPGSDSRFGMSLFFNGNNVVPGISVFAQERTNSVVPNFSANASGSTPTQVGTGSIFTNAAANSRSFASGGQAVTITGYQWDAPSINNTDRVSPYFIGPNGVPDYTGQITLSVYSISSNTWAGFAANDNWSSAGNWTADGHDGVAPAQDGTAHIIFTGTTRSTPNVDLPWNVASIAFDNVSGPFAIGGQPIAVQSGGITNNAVSYGQIINNNINAFQAQTWTATGAMFFNGSVALGGTLTIDGSASTSIAGPVSGNGGFIKNGVGTLTLSGGAANTFTGPIVVNSGVVLLDKPDVANATLSGVSSVSGANTLTIGNGSGSAIVRLQAQDQINDYIATTINAGGVLDINGYSEYMAPITLKGGTIQTGTGFISLAGFLFNGQPQDILTVASSTTASITGRVNLNASAILNVAAGTTASGIDLDIPAVCYNGSMVKNGAGTLRLSGANTFAGGLTANAGTVLIGASSNLTAGTGPVGTGTLTIQNATIQADGAIRLLENPINLIAGSPGAAVAGSFELDLTGVISGSGGLTKNGSGDLSLDALAANTYAGVTRVNDGALYLQNPAGSAVTGSSLIIGDSVGTALSARVLETSLGNNQIGDSTPVTINRDGLLEFVTASDFLVSTTFNGGAIFTDTSPSFVSLGPVTVNSNSNTSSISGRVNQNATFTWNVAKGTTASGIDLDVPATIFGIGGLIKTGAGALRLSGANTYAGATTVNDGDLNLQSPSGNAVTGSSLIIGDNVGSALSARVVENSSGNDQIGDSTLVTINNDGQLLLLTASDYLLSTTFNGGSITTDNSKGFVSPGPITVNANSSTASIHGRVNQTATSTWSVAKGTTRSGIDLDVPATVFGVGGLIKTGEGTTRLSGANTYSGGTTVQGGILQLGANGAAGSGPLTLTSGTFDLNGFNQTVPSLTFSDVGDLSAMAVSGAGALTLIGDITFDGQAGGPLQPATLASNLILTSGNHMIAHSVIVIGSAFVINGIIGGDGGLTLGNNVGNVDLTGQNTYAGPTILDFGILGLGVTNALPAQTALTDSAYVNLDSEGDPHFYNQTVGSLAGTGVIQLGTATLTVGGNNTSTVFSGVIHDTASGHDALIKIGSGTLTLTGANDYSGNTKISAGTLKFNINSGAATIGAAATVTIAPGATLEMAGSISALGTAGGNRAHIVNNSTASGLVVSGTNQVVGGIDGIGDVQVNAGSDLTADHIIQNALFIGGTPGSPGLVTIDASDASGNPLGQPSGLELAGSLTQGGPFGEGVISSAMLSTVAADGTAPPVLAMGNSVGSGNPAPVPEPSTLLLALFAILGVLGTPFARHYFLRQTV